MPDEAPDSISFAQLLSNPTGKGTRQNLIMQSVTSFVVRDGDWKLCLCPGSGTPAKLDVAAGNDPMPSVAWRTALDQLEGKLPASRLYHAPFVQLFNLANDPHEDHNLAADSPDRAARMVALLKQQIADGRSTPGPKQQNDRPVTIVNPRDKRLPDFVSARFD